MWVNVCDGGKEQRAAAAYLISCSGHAASFVNEGEHGKGGVDRGPLQQVEAVLVVYEFHIAPVNALGSILLLHGVFYTSLSAFWLGAVHYVQHERWVLEKYCSGITVEYV